MKKVTKQVWRMKDGTAISVGNMTDSHLINSIRMIARTWSLSHPGQLPPTENYKMLCQEASKRGMKIKLLSSPIQIDDKKEWIEISTQPMKSRLIPGFLPSELDSRDEA